MIYVGIDLDRKFSHLAALAEDGSELLSRKVVNEPEALKAILAELGGEARVALEATFGWEWLVELLEAEGHELHLADPLRTRAIAAARLKTDAVDARTLAHLLRADLLPEAYVAPRELRDLRSLLRHRVALTQMRSALKNRVHAVLAAHRRQRPYQRLFGPNGRRFLAELELREPPRRRLDSLLRLIDDFDREIELARREIDALAEHDPRVDVLVQLKAIGPYTAMLVIAEAGEIERFPDARHFCSYAGLTPTVRSSAERARLGHISRQAHRTSAGRWSRLRTRRSSSRGRCGRASSGSPADGGGRSRPSPSLASCSRSVTTDCATERSVASKCLGRASATGVLAPPAGAPGLVECAPGPDDHSHACSASSHVSWPPS